MIVASSPRSARLSSMTTTTRCWSTSTVETVTRPPDPSSRVWAPLIRAAVLSAVTVTVKVLLRVTFSSTGPGTGRQSSRSVVGSTGPPDAVGDDDGVLVSVGDGSEVPGGGLGSGGTDESRRRAGGEGEAGGGGGEQTTHAHTPMLWAGCARLAR